MNLLLMADNMAIDTVQMVNPERTRPLSPCIQICRVDSASQRCEGCGRTLDEIACWSRMSEADKAPVWERLEAEGFVGEA